MKNDCGTRSVKPTMTYHGYLTSAGSQIVAAM
jgi:hypothetical protein